MVALGIDTGGTFTDLTMVRGRNYRIHKIPSTPRNPAEAFLKGIHEICRGLSPDSITHGSTVTTNALLERKGARVALVTTAGFEDVLSIGRQNRPNLYDIGVEKPPPLIEHEDIFGIEERTLYDGTVEREPEIGKVRHIADMIAEGHYDSIALCFLHAYANPSNERRVEAILQRTGLPVSASHRILPEHREYERFSTTSVNAYVAPKMSAYLGLIEERIPENARLRIMQSNGGSISAARARQETVQTILSGPAAGVVGAYEVARMAGFGKIITFDMGGTSTDVSLCDDAVSLRNRSMIGGCPIAIPVVDIHTVGAGGGSISWMDPAGSFHVGPRSAGAEPGPVCYGRGSELTVADANLCLGRMSAEHFLGGAMRLDIDRTREQMLIYANTLGMSPDHVAEGILKVANAIMERAIRVISIERGYDPRQFSLVAFGGAGPMHACDLARALAIPNIIIPNNAGVLSALGLLMADVSKDFSQTVLLRGDDVSPGDLESLFAPLESRAREILEEEGFKHSQISLQRFLDLRYIGQSYEVPIQATADFLTAFHSEHFRLYGHSSNSRAVELVNVRLMARGSVESPGLLSDEETGMDSRGVAIGTIYGIFEGKKYETPIFNRADLQSGCHIMGPALITEMSATTVIAPDYEATVDRFRNIIMGSRTN